MVERTKFLHHALTAPLTSMSSTKTTTPSSGIVICSKHRNSLRSWMHYHKMMIYYYQLVTAALSRSISLVRKKSRSLQRRSLKTGSLKRRAWSKGRLRRTRTKKFHNKFSWSNPNQSTWWKTTSTSSKTCSVRLHRHPMPRSPTLIQLRPKRSQSNPRSQPWPSSNWRAKEKMRMKKMTRRKKNKRRSNLSLKS